MVALVGKATPDLVRGHIELYLVEFQKMLGQQGRFVYAWTFNPDENAIRVLREHIDSGEDVFLYLPEIGGRSHWRMHLADFRHQRLGGLACPKDWEQFCIKPLSNRSTLRDEDEEKKPAPIHLWFLVDEIEELHSVVNLTTSFKPVFKDKYEKWGQNFFAFLQ